MPFVHGKGTTVTVDSDDLSEFTNNVQFNRSADSHDTTTFGQDSHTFQAGLGNGTATISGIYDSGATGPGKILRPLVKGANVTFVYQPEGTGTGKPTATVQVQVTAYEETAPVADMITWSATLQFSGDVADTTQV